MSKYFTKIHKLCTFYEEYGATYHHSFTDDKKPILSFHNNTDSEQILEVNLFNKTDKQIFKEINDFFVNSIKNWIKDEKIDKLLNEYINRDYSNFKTQRLMIKKIYNLLKKTIEEE